MKISLHALQADFEQPFIFYQESEDVNPLLHLDKSNFMHPQLSKGTYVLCISYRWNDLAEENSFLKQVNMAVTSPSPVSIQNLHDELGLKLLRIQGQPDWL